MITFIGKLTRTKEGYKITMPVLCLEEGKLAAHSMLSVELREPTAPHRIIVPTLQTKVQRFGKEYALSIPALFITSGTLRLRGVYKASIREAQTERNV